MKNKNIFKIIFIILLSVISGLSIMLYDNFKGRNVNMESVFESPYLLNTELQYFILDKATELDPEYEVLSFDESIPEEIRQEYNAIVYSNMQNASVQLENDQNLQYSFTNTNTNQTISSINTDLLNPDAAISFYGTLEYSTEGYNYYGGDFNYDLLDTYAASLFNYEYSYGDEFNAEGVMINRPKNLSITIATPDKIVYDGGPIASASANLNGQGSYVIIELMIAASIVSLFILFSPIRIEEEVQPFKSFKNIKFGLNVILQTCMLTFMIFAVMYLSFLTINDILLNEMTRLNIPFASPLLITANFIVWFICLLCISIAIFSIKYIFYKGFKHYFKENTYLGVFIRYMKRSLDQIADIDLSQPNNLTLMKHVLIHVLIIAIISCFWAFGWVLAILYGFFLFFYLKSKLTKIQSDYNALLNATHEIGEGHFDIEIQDDLGVFNRLKDEFKNIKSGFKKAVEEETKSQNMKTELVSNVSHDLKTPLTGIKNYIELLQDSTLDEDTRNKYLQTLNQYSDRLSRLIEDLFEVSKVNSGNIQLELVDLNIIALIEQAQAECLDLLENRQLQVIFNAPEHPIILSLDGDKTYRIFENLYTNISKYALSNTRVYIDIEETENEVSITFKNISETQMNFVPDEIVDRFVRGDKSRHESGSGLGLAIVKSFTEVQNGRFHIEIDGDLFKAIVTFKK